MGVSESVFDASHKDLGKQSLGRIANETNPTGLESGRTKEESREVIIPETLAVTYCSRMDRIHPSVLRSRYCDNRKYGAAIPAEIRRIRVSRVENRSAKDASKSSEIANSPCRPMLP